MFLAGMQMYVEQNIYGPIWPEHCQFWASHLIKKQTSVVPVVEIRPQVVKLSDKVLTLGK